MEHELKIGDIVVMKTNWDVRYTLIAIEEENGICLTHDNKRLAIPLIALEKFDNSRYFSFF